MVGLKHPRAKDCFPAASDLSHVLARAWKSFSGITTCRSLVALYRGRCVAHLGLINAAAQPGDAQLGCMAEQVMRDGRANNLANLARYPGACQHVWQRSGVVPPYGLILAITEVGTFSMPGVNKCIDVSVYLPGRCRSTQAGVDMQENQLGLCEYVGAAAPEKVG